MSIPDFNSLYPWLMASLFLCYCNLLTPVTIKKFGLCPWEYRVNTIGGGDTTYCGYELNDKLVIINK